jgi:hypothetical protein
MKMTEKEKLIRDITRGTVQDGRAAMGWLHWLDRLIAAIIATAQWLALPLILLLFLQWPRLSLPKTIFKRIDGYQFIRNPWRIASPLRQGLDPMGKWIATGALAE